MTNLLAFIPAVCLLFSIMLIVIFVLSKFGNIIFEKSYNSNILMLLIAMFLFLIILIAHLFKPEDWTADILKILIGIIVGSSASKLTKNNSKSSVDINGGSIAGDIAGRDIHKNIQNLKDSISHIKDSIIHQQNEIKQTIANSEKNDFLINTIYERGDNISGAIERVVRYWTLKEWSLKHFSSDYQGADGIFLVFTRKMSENKPSVYYKHGSDTKKFDLTN